MTLNWEAMTADEAEALAAGMYEAEYERIPAVTVGEPQPEEWIPVGHEAPPARYEPHRTAILNWVFGEEGDDAEGDTEAAEETMALAE